MVKILDPVKFSMSRAGFDDVGEAGLNLLNPGSVGQIALRYQALINVAARRVGLQSQNASFRAINDEIVVLGRSLAAGERDSIVLRNKVESAQLALAEAWPVRRQLLRAVEEEARKDVLSARQAVANQVRNASIRDELLAIIDEVSRSTRFG